MMVGRVGKEIGGRDGVGRPDDFTGLEMPPHIRIIESRPYREDSKNNQKAGQHDWKRENSWQETNVCPRSQRR